MDVDRVEFGQKMLSMMWRDMVEKIVQKAIDVYELDPDQSSALRKAFLFTAMGNVIPG